MSGAPTRPGADWRPEETRFAVRSPHATAVELCFYEASGRRTARHELRRQGDLWSAVVAGVPPGQRYGYRVDGPYDPADGHRFNPAKLLVDPWARAVAGELEWGPGVLGYGDQGPESAVASTLDSAGQVPWSVVVDPGFDWRDDQPPGTPWRQSVIYEAHVRGLTRRHPAVPPEQRGTYLGLAHDAVVEHLLSLGVTAVELMPVFAFGSERHLVDNGLTNYWGYSPLAWCAPHAGYASAGGDAVHEFKTMVRALHQAGLEVLLDVVYNHSVEGGAAGATLSLRGLDNRSYYRLDPENPSRYEDFTGCGNTLDFSQAAVCALAHESLRYWVEEMHVDGFRFDLAPALGRDGRDFTSKAAFFEGLASDPVFAGTKLIAEPWDLGPDGYRLGQFPPGWAEWNDRYRDGLKRFWRGDRGAGPEALRRLAGSADLFPERGPAASINYVAAHDGFTLADLVAYEKKHNLANGEDNRDGSDHDLSSNWGVEGPTTATSIREVRSRVQRALLASLALSAGVPMLAHGDELGRTQGGNNNAYCQDNETSWIDWQGADLELLALTRQVLASRRELAPILWAGSSSRPTWLDRHGEEHDSGEGAGGENRWALLWHCETSDDKQVPTKVLVLLNGESSAAPFALPRATSGSVWVRRLDTGAPTRRSDGEVRKPVTVTPHSLMCLTLQQRASPPA